MNSQTSKSVTQEGPLSHMVQLDGLRALAFFCVLFWHFGHSSVLGNVVQWGWVGVRLFFVLSGFLITRILLQYRQKIESEKHSSWWTLKNFYIRRFLRIFPLYYLFVVVVFLGLPRIREDIVWYLLYLQNLLFSMENAFGICPHLWTLAVEEQFYLFWPFLIILVPHRWLFSMIIASIAVGPITRLAVLMAGGSSLTAMVLTPSNMDTLAMGALLAYFNVHKTAVETQKFARNSLALGLPIILVYVVCHNLGFDRLSREEQSGVEWGLFVSADFGSALIYTWLIYNASIGFSGLVGKFLCLRPLTYLGKISYGLYLFHLPVQKAYEDIIFPRLGWQIFDSAIVTFSLFSVTTFVVSVLSWHLFEKPINDFKKHFPYIKPPEKVASENGNATS